ncbi:MAG: adenylate/guanylate cyclase domain-containing protein [Bacteroidota bacterium]|nr:adenylate/guanylate cyclase domain-containing protein [Bacteroidota bacterium]
MKRDVFLYILLILLYCPFCLLAQRETNESKTVDSLFHLIRNDPKIPPERKSTLADSAFNLSTGDKCRQVLSRVLQGAQLAAIELPDSAIQQLMWANKNFITTCDSTILISIYANLTNVYINLAEYERIDSIGRIVERIWNYKWKDKVPRLAILNNVGIARATKIDSDIEGSLLAFHEAYRSSLEANSNDFIQKSLINLGSIKGMIGELDSAYYFFTLASKNARQQDDIENFMSLQINLANLDIERGNFIQAHLTLDSLQEVATAQKNNNVLSDILFTQADLAARQNNFPKAYEYLRDYVKQYEIFMDDERVKAVTETLEKYEAEKKARQIQQLEIENLDVSLTNERVTNTRNRFMFIGLGILIVAIALLSRLQYVHKSRVAIRAEKDKSDVLLLNILPASVAEELKTTGTAAAKLYDEATILFSDFKDFTDVSGILNPTDLLDEINACFKVFDEITTKYGIEKIKTIGDSYMAAGSVPDTNTATPADVVHAAIEMQQFVVNRKKNRTAQQLPAFEMRLGIHTGPVVAGIVGVKKFQYDLWGDTVNIASRMESNGETARVNISAATYELIKDNPGMIFTPRGLINVKGKGEMAMYFVDLATAPNGSQII